MDRPVNRSGLLSGMTKLLKSIGIGVVGCGYWGPNLIRNFRILPECQVRAMCDLSNERLDHLGNLYPEVECFTDFQALLSCDNLDAIIISVPVRFHYSLARASLLAGKHTLIEKPMASSVAECDELIKLADSLGLVLMVGHTFLYSSSVRKIEEIVASGEIGDVRHIHARRLNLGLFQKDINVAWDLAPHDISIIIHILKATPDTVNCQGKANINQGIEDTCSMSLSFSGNRWATIQSSWLEPRKVREMTIVGTRGMIVYDDLLGGDSIRIFDVRVECPPYYDTYGDFQYAYHYGDSRIPHVKHEEPLKVECQHFLDCIRNSATPITSGVTGREVVRILEASSLSMKGNGIPVHIQTHTAADELLPGGES